MTLAAGFVLIVRPALIPASIGIALAPDANLLSYLLAAAEFGFATLSVFGAYLTEPGALRAVLVSIVVLHGTSGFLEASVWLMHASPVLAANIVGRAIIVAVLLWLLPRSADSGRRASPPRSDR